MTALQPNEHRLDGQWLKIGGKVVADDNTLRIYELISSELRKLATTEDGWDTLYIDNQDGRKWELTYPHKEWHGGGPPTLTHVSEEYIRMKYSI